ncbi:interferon-induced 35 kDa protein homolog [Esox lucius]|uniref:NID domain-containing protein n=1 Tax=Esox lucius TaxID=8010 RepID=A0A3P9AEG1_ESOLU|nr:interferon-induced 35 kDa protein homolog [Esox lucius]
MSLDEDFSLVMDPQDPLQQILTDINKMKLQHGQLVKEQQDLNKAKYDQEDLAEKFRTRTVRMKKSLEEDEIIQARDVESERNKMAAMLDEESRLRREIQNTLKELQHEEQSTQHLKQQTDVSSAVPEKRVVFTGETGNGVNALDFDVKPRIVYPMKEGTALITFEEDIVAQKILNMREHKVDLGSDVTITLEAKPIRLLLPSQVELDTQVCPRRILVSNLPKKIPADRLLDKLEIHFAKTKNGGGEVEESDMLHDSGHVVITFTKDNVAKGLTDKLYHDVEFDKKTKHSVKVTPFLNGEVTQLQTRLSVCGRTVLLTGIPDIMDQENLQDLLEIHFQKASTGGGEVDAILFNPVGQHTLAVFEEDCPIKDKS